MVGRRSYRNVVSVIGTLLAIFISTTFVSIELRFEYLLFLVFLLPITFTINHFIGSAFGSIAFWVKDSRDYSAVDNMYHTVRSLLNGTIIPIYLLPLPAFLQTTPYAWMLHHPMQIYLGEYSNLEILYVFLGGIAWCITLYFLAKFIFLLGLKNNESVGL